MWWLRDKILLGLGKATNKKRRIYISRQDSNRRVSNEDEIIEALKKFDFETFIMSSLSPTDQMNIFRSAEIVVMPHGAAGVHLLLAPQEAKIIELHSPGWLNSCYAGLCNSLGISYEAIIGNQTSLDLDYSIDPEHLQYIVREKIVAINEQ